MTSQENSFALLGGEEVDDLLTFLEGVAAKVDASWPPAAPQRRNNQKSGYTPATPKFTSWTLPAAEYVSTERGRGRGGPCRGSGSSGGNEKVEYGRPHGFQRNYEGANGYQLSDRGTNGYQRNGVVDGYRRNNGGANGFHQNYGTANGYRRNYRGYSAENTVDGNLQEHGYGHGGGRGRDHGQQRGSDEEHGFGNQIQVVKGDEQPENRDPEGGSGGGGGGGGSEKLTNGHNYRENRQLRNGNWSYGGGGRGYRDQEGSNVGGREGRNNRRGEIMSKSGTKEALDVDGGHAVSGDGNTGGDEKNVSATIEISKDVESEQEKLDRLARQECHERKKMTLEQYEKLLMEKRKALETINTAERKVTVDKDFELMHLVEKKKDDSLFIKPKPEKEKLKRKDSIDKNDKVHKAKTRQLSLDEVFHIKSSGQGRGRGQRVNREEIDTVRGGSERGLINRKNEADTGRERVEQAGIRHGEQGRYRGGHSKFRVAVPAIGDSLQFPLLGKSA